MGNYEKELLEITIELEALITTRLGMEVENESRRAEGKSIAWNCDSFFELSDKISALNFKALDIEIAKAKGA